MTWSIPAEHVCGNCGIKVDPQDPDRHVCVWDDEGKVWLPSTARKAHENRMKAVDAHRP